ncbi:MAG: hypothetical protein K8I82_17910, partial [Anaerolineae bacterium]|nr:hypothetical protein [Anaerolineae bacterium]
MNWKTLWHKFRWLRRIRRIFFTLYLMIGGLFCFAIFGMVFVLILAPYLVGIPTEFITRYGNAELIYQGEGSFYGSAEGGVVTYIYWTQDSVQDVQNHYESFFPAFTQQTAYEKIDDQRVLQQWLSTGSDLIVTGISVSIAQADQSVLEHPMVNCLMSYPASNHPCTM